MLEAYNFKLKRHQALTVLACNQTEYGGSPILSLIDQRSMLKYDDCSQKYTLRGTNRKELIDPDESKVTSHFK